MPWLNIRMTYWAGCSFWNTRQQNQKQIWHKINKFIFKALYALKAFSFPAKKSLMETFRDIKKHSLMQLQITSHSLLCVRIQCAVIWVKQSTRVKPHQGFEMWTIPNLTFLSATKGNSAPVPQAGCLIYFPCLWSQIDIFPNLGLFSWDNNAPRFPSGAAHLLLLSF